MVRIQDFIVKLKLLQKEMMEEKAKQRASIQNERSLKDLDSGRAKVCRRGNETTRDASANGALVQRD